MKSFFGICLFFAVMWSLDGFTRFHCKSLCAPKGFCKSYIEARYKHAPTSVKAPQETEGSDK